MKHNKSSRLFVVAIVAIGIINIQRIAATEEFKELSDKIRAFHKNREELLLRSEGRCSVALYRSVTPEFNGASLNTDLTVEEEKGRATSESAAQFMWKCQDGTVRYDVYIPKAENENNAFLSQHTRVVYDKERCIFYDVLDERAYINRPPEDCAGLTYISNRFDVGKFYTFADRDLPRLLDWFERKGITPESVVPIREADMDCLQITYRHRVMKNDILLVERIFNFLVVPKLSYSMVKGEIDVWHLVDGEMVQVARDTLSAEYNEDVEHSGVWFVRKLLATSESVIEGVRLLEKIEVTVHEIALGVDVDKSEFTFEGMDVPLGTIVYDKRLSGQPAELQLREDGLHPISVDDPSYPERSPAYERQARNSELPDFVQENTSQTLSEKEPNDGEAAPEKATTLQKSVSVPADITEAVESDGRSGAALVIGALSVGTIIFLLSYVALVQNRRR